MLFLLVGTCIALVFRAVYTGQAHGSQAGYGSGIMSEKGGVDGVALEEGGSFIVVSLHLTCLIYPPHFWIALYDVRRLMMLLIRRCGHDYCPYYEMFALA